MQVQKDKNFQFMERRMGSSKEKDFKGQYEKEKSQLHLATGALFTEEEPQNYKKRKSSLKEIKRRGSIAVNASIQKLFGERSYYLNNKDRPN